MEFNLHTLDLSFPLPPRLFFSHFLLPYSQGTVRCVQLSHKTCVPLQGEDPRIPPGYPRILPIVLLFQLTMDPKDNKPSTPSRRAKKGESEYLEAVRYLPYHTTAIYRIAFQDECRTAVETESLTDASISRYYRTHPSYRTLPYPSV